MQAKLILWLLSSALLLQISYGANVDEEKTGYSTAVESNVDLLNQTGNTTAAKSTIADSTVTPPTAVYQSNVGPLDMNVTGFFPHLRLLILMSQDFYPMFFTALGNGQKLFADVIADLDTIDNKSELLKEKIKELENFNKEVDELSQAKYFHCYEYIGKLEEFIDKLDSLNATALVDPTDDEIIVTIFLRLNGQVEMEQRIVQAFGAYLTVLSKELFEFEKLLNNTEISHDHDLQDWLMEVKNIIKRIGSLVLFLELRNGSK